MGLPGMIPLVPVDISEQSVQNAQIFYGVTIPLIVLAAATFLFRMSKATVRRSIWSDACIVAGFALTMADFGLIVPQMYLTPGRKTAEQAIMGSKGIVLAIPIWGMSLAFTKASIGLTLLAIQQAIWFQIFVWANIVLAGMYGFANMWFILLSCHPLELAWLNFAVPVEDQCLPTTHLETAALIGAVVSISTDIMLSLAPISFLWNLNQSRRERVVVGFLMSMGLLAGVSSLLKIVSVATYRDINKDDDTAAMGVTVAMWTMLEQLLGVIAACTPYCKPVFERCLLAVGVPVVRAPGPSPSPTSYYQRATENDMFRSHVEANRTKFESDEDPLNIEMQARVNSGGSSRDEDGKIYKRTEVHIVTEALRSDNAADGWKKYTP